MTKQKIRNHKKNMKPSIIVSTKDTAGMNIKKKLLDRYGFLETDETFQGNKVLKKEGIKLYTTNNETIYSDNIDSEVEGDWVIFATRHKSASGKKSFSVHAPGNWGSAELGGIKNTICNAAACAMKDAINKIKNTYSGDEFAVAMECTHHGPFLKKPSMFIEIGSSDAEWTRDDCGEIIAKTVNHLIISTIKRYKTVAVLGGGHYNQIATKLMLNTEYAVGHICPKHNLTHLDKELLKQISEKNGEKFEMIILDWKGMAAEKQKITELLDELNLKYEKYQKLSKEED